METARAGRAHVIWTSVALVVVIIASSLTYVLLSKVTGDPSVKTISDSSLFKESIRHQTSREYWILKAQNYSRTDDCLIWENEWPEYRNENESIVDQTNTRIIIREKGVYLVYIQANFKLKPQKNRSSPVDLKLLVEFKYSEDTKLFAAAHDNQVVNTVQDAKLNTFLLMNMNLGDHLCVKAYPGDMVNYDAEPFSTFITIIKWSDDW